MTQQITDPFEQAIRQSGEGWLIDWYAPRDQALPHLRQILAEADEWSRTRFGGNAPRLTPETIVATFSRNPHKAKAFLQVLASAGTPQMRVMVWRILQGMSVGAICLEYRAEETFMLSIQLVSPYGETEEYKSSDIDDAVVLRHVGILKMGDKGFFEGFFPLRLRGE